MALTERLPGMKPGSTVRNVAVGAGYLFLVMMIIGALAGPTDTVDDNNQTDTETDTPAGGDATATATDGGAAATDSPTATQPPTDSPTATAEPTPADQSFSGTGDQATGRFSVAGGLTIFDLSHAASDGNFAVWLKNSDGERVELLANDIGQYEGSLILNVPPGEYFLDVDANGEWQATVRQPRPTSGASLPQSMEEVDSDYVGPVQYDGAVRVTFRGQDDEHYGVWHLDESGERRELLINEIGPTGEQSTVFSAEGIWFIQVETGGAWTIEVEAA